MLARTSSRTGLGGLKDLAASAPCRQPWPKRRHTLTARCQHRLILYTKPECPLCDGLKSKVQGVIDRAAFMPSALSGASLEVRDISTNMAWQDAMHLSVPVLKVLATDADGNSYEVELPRSAPRITADRLERQLTKALQHASADQ